MRLLLVIILMIGLAFFAMGQTVEDSIKGELPAVIIQATRPVYDITRLKSVQGTYIYEGKKNEVIDLNLKNIALAEKYGRQIFSKIPGVFVYDMDGTGNQLNIATRGLDPHRGWEFNVRKDGIITNSDMYGYPASHYSIPMEAVERIELVRGNGSLQYGSQFGGMINYVSKQPDSIRKFAFENISTVGSYGLVSTFNRASGTLGKFKYSTWVNKKWVTGYRDNGESEYGAEAVTLYFDPIKSLHFKIELTHSNYRIHLAGPLTDKMFKDDPTQSTRDRNHYNPNIFIPSFGMDWDISAATRLQFTSSAVLGSRNSVIYDRPATVADTIVRSTLTHNPRQVDIDRFNSYTSELRLLHSYHIGERRHTVVGGVQLMDNLLVRRQLGKGTVNNDFDLTRTDPIWGRDLKFKSHNVAVFIENKFQLLEKLSLNAGVRLEIGASNVSGSIVYYQTEDIPNQIIHKFPLLGFNMQYDLTKNMNLYGGWSQAYRPVIFKDIIPGSVFEISDKNLKDAKGYNLEAGYRGAWKNFTWDIGVFQLLYKNRLGTIATSDASGNLIIRRTNIGHSTAKGIELFVQKDFYPSNKSVFSVFTSSSYLDAKYKNAIIRSGSTNIDVSGKDVESTPRYISRNGASFRYSLLSMSLLYSYTAKSFADVFNAVQPNASGSTGVVPAYGLTDINGTIQCSKNVKILLNVNNLFDKSYFTKRPQFYPGPGIWPSDGRTYSITANIQL